MGAARLVHVDQLVDRGLSLIRRPLPLHQRLGQSLLVVANPFDVEHVRSFPEYGRGGKPHPQRFQGGRGGGAEIFRPDTSGPSGFACHALAFGVWPLSNNAPCRRREKSGSGAQGRTSLIKLMARYPAPRRAFLPGQPGSNEFHALASPGPGFLDENFQTALPLRSHPAPSLPRSPGSRPAFPCRRCKHYAGGRGGVDKIFDTGSARPSSRKASGQTESEIYPRFDYACSTAASSRPSGEAAPSRDPLSSAAGWREK